MILISLFVLTLPFVNKTYFLGEVSTIFQISKKVIAIITKKKVIFLKLSLKKKKVFF